MTGVQTCALPISGVEARFYTRTQPQYTMTLDDLADALDAGTLRRVWRIPLGKHSVVLMKWSTMLDLSEDSELKL